ncbi:hypothetical protein [Streptomyces sp. NPDC057838]|uniref:hypothetical protein n=1 Tax=unclassified Streptomyces TaxID=2593676 RepID=UPI00369F8183
MTSRTSNGAPRPATGAGRGPAVEIRYRLRLRVDSRGWVLARSFDDRRGFISTYAPGTVVEIDLGRGHALRHYDAARIAEAVAHCQAVYLVSAVASGEWPHIEYGTAFNADGALQLLRLAIDRAVYLRGASAC